MSLPPNGVDLDYALDGDPTGNPSGWCLRSGPGVVSTRLVVNGFLSTLVVPLRSADARQIRESRLMLIPVEGEGHR